MSETRPAGTSTDADGNLSTHLAEHLLASKGGAHALKGAARIFTSSPQEHALSVPANGIARNRRDRAGITRQLDFRPKKYHPLFSVVLRPTGNVNPVNSLRLRRRSMARLELDVLTGAAREKRSKWALLALSKSDSRFDAVMVADCGSSAEHQITEVQRTNCAKVHERCLEDQA